MFKEFDFFSRAPLGISAADGGNHGLMYKFEEK